MSEPLVLAGFNAVLAALRSDRLEPVELTLRDERGRQRLAPLVEAARRRGVPVRTLSPERLDRLSGGEAHQGAVLTVRAWPYRDETDLSTIAGKEGEPAFLVILDHLQDVGNLGAVIRSAHLCGADGVVIPRDRAAQVTPAVVRASAGAAALTDVYRVTNVVQTVGKLKQAGVWVLGLDANGSRALPQADLTVPLALVLGGEHRGLSRLVRETCDELFRLPMRGVIGSFNASVAAGIALAEVLRQRHPVAGGTAGRNGEAPFFVDRPLDFP